MIYSEVKVSGIEDVEKRLGNMKKEAPAVVSRAINRAIQNVKKNMGKETSSRYFITSGEVKKTVNVTKATKSRLKAAAISQGGGIALSKFKVNPGTPVRYRGKSRSPKVYKAGVKKSGGAKPLDGDPKSFVAVMKSGHKGVFTRISGDGLPIKQNYGPSVPQMVKNEDIMKIINKDANETLKKRIDAEVSNILRKG
ncbi:phage tail protein [Anaerocolumna xylanovorans]|uniref:Prophage minor tail protein Z (GPZ) n=1 Tax=Anaerocolumna xylanovorans DSM 12503 TaxID=1121345 RepID=A0A1M7YBS8_9FIRM|nr:phage tail protein [Anaerocolumna xylanovorans]SHO50073.1 Prophage minor tail protein Z (GPZ) [Anaerocolumna xylanovorans DSM 12503]